MRIVRNWFLLILLFVGLTAPCLFAESSGNCDKPQTDLLELLRKALKREQKEETKKKSVSLQIIPFIAASPSVGVSFGGAMSAVGYRENEQENVSSLMGSVSISTEGQFIFVSRSDITRGNFWRFIGDWRFYDYTERTYGLGANSSPDVYTDVKYKWVRFRQGLLLPVMRHLDMGAEYDLDEHLDVKPFQVGEFTPTTASRSSGISPVLVYDNTDNRINASRGVYTRLAYHFFPKKLGSDNPWQEFDGEARFYFHLPTCRRQVLAFWEIAQIVTDGTPPYFDLPSSGWDTYGRGARGYSAGRYRGYGWLYSELEYRTDITSNGLFGAILFANASSFSADDRQQFKQWLPAGGFGFRFKIDKKTASNLAVDFGFGKQGSKTVYLAFNETF